MKPALKKISPASIQAALEKAIRYRVLNQPDQAESIARDILAVKPDEQDALQTLGLSLTDQLLTQPDRFQETLDTFKKLSDPYERSYHVGIAYERMCRARMLRDPAKSLRWLVAEALRAYEEAERLRPAGNDESILRWNSLVRLMEQAPDLVPVEAAASSLPEGDDTLDFGDAPPS